MRPHGRLSRKLTIAFGILFSVVFLVTSALVYSRAEALVYQTIDSSLDSTSDLIKRIVQVAIENNRGQVSKDLIVAEHFIGQNVSLDYSTLHRLDYLDSITEEKGGLSLPGMRVEGALVSGSDDLVDRIHQETKDVVTIFQLSDKGFVSIASAGQAGVARQIGKLIPKGSPIDILVRREGIYYGRDYFDKRWYLTAYKLLYSRGAIVGALFVAIEQTDLFQLRRDILSIRVGRTGFPYIIDTLSYVVIHPKLEGESLYSLAHIKDIIFEKDGDLTYYGTDPVSGRRMEYIAYFKFVPEMNWIVVVGSSTEDLFGGLQALRSAMVAIFGLALAATLAFCALVGRGLTKPIRTITEKFKDISEGEADLSRRLYVKSEDEIGELAVHFNLFLDKLKALKEIERRSVEVSLKDAQMNALQAQINPHFLYNTLESIHFMIAMGDPRSVEMVQFLADLFRISIGKGERYVTLKQEIEHVQLFVSIQEMRYPGRFTMRCSIDERLLDYYTLKFLLQPLVENSIHHGFELIESGGLVDLSAEIEGEKLVLRVVDNGVGLSPERLERLRSQLRGYEQGKSIGLLNVHERIALHFGDDYGLTIDGQEGRGTTVTLLLPILKLEPEASYAVSELAKIQF